MKVVNSLISSSNDGMVKVGLGQRLVRKIPHIKLTEGSVSSFMQSAYDKISSPEQRLIMGATALFTQPFIDLNNKRVNEDTRLMAFSRTLAKIIVGTTVGVIVRKECIRLAKNFSTLIPFKKLDGTIAARKADSRSFLAPKRVDIYSPDKKRGYENTVGTLLGIGVMLVTNFLIDAPLTQIFTNIFYKHVKNVGGSDEN